MSAPSTANPLPGPRVRVRSRHHAGAVVALGPAIILVVFTSFFSLWIGSAEGALTERAANGVLRPLFFAQPSARLQLLTLLSRIQIVGHLLLSSVVLLGSILAITRRRGIRLSILALVITCAALVIAFLTFQIAYALSLPTKP